MAVPRASKKSLLLVPTLVVTVAAMLCGCRSGGADNTVGKLADALKKQGIAWETISKLERDQKRVKGLIDEAFVLEGENLVVEVYRVEKDKFFKTAAMGLVLRAGFEPEHSENALQDVCVHQPFLLAVVEEPEEHAVRQALARVFPEKE